MTFYDNLTARDRAEEEILVRVERRGDRAVVTLDDPAKLNVLSATLYPTATGIAGAARQRSEGPSGRAHRLRSGILGRRGSPMMSRAPEALAASEGSTDIWRWIRYQFGAVARLLAHSDTAFIAALNGPAAGVGLAWALTCDLVIASGRARIVPAFGRLGLLPEVGTSWALTRRPGYQGAFAFYAAGQPLTAHAAKDLGLVHEVVAHHDLLAAANAWCDQICSLPPHAIAMTKPLLRAAADATWENALTMEEFAEPQCFTTHAFQGSVQELLSTR